MGNEELWRGLFDLNFDTDNGGSDSDVSVNENSEQYSESEKSSSSESESDNDNTEIRWNVNARPNIPKEEFSGPNPGPHQIWDLKLRNGTFLSCSFQLS